MFEEPEEEKVVVKEVPKERDWLLIKLNGDKKKYLEEIMDTLSFYSGDVNVVIEQDGKRFRFPQKVRQCNALESELLSCLDAEDYSFFKA
jgi:hypothetical protein